MVSSTSAPPWAGGALAVWPMSRSDHALAERAGLGASLLAFCLALMIATLAALAPAEAAPQNREPVRAQVTAEVSGGYARLAPKSMPAASAVPAPAAPA